MCYSFRNYVDKMTRNFSRLEFNTGEIRRNDIQLNSIIFYFTDFLPHHKYELNQTIGLWSQEQMTL